MPMKYSDTNVPTPNYGARRFERGLRTGIDLGSDAALVKLRESVERRMLNKKSLLDEAREEKENTQSWEAVQGRISSLPAEDQARFANFPKTKAGAEQASAELERYLKSHDTTAKDEATKKEKQTSLQQEYDAIRVEAEGLGPGVAQELQPFIGIKEPTEASNKRFAAALERVYKKMGEKPPTPDKPSESEKAHAVRVKLAELGNGDIEAGLRNAKTSDKKLYNDAIGYGIKVEDKASPKAEKLLEDVMGEWQYEKDRYTNAIAKAQQAINKRDEGTEGKTAEELVEELGITDPPPITMYAFKYLSDRKAFLNEEAVNEAFKRISTKPGDDKTGRGMLPMPAEGAPPMENTRNISAAPTAGEVPEGDAAALQQKLSRADAILEKLEEEMGLRK